MKFLKAELLGVRVHAVTRDALVRRIVASISTRSRLTVGHQNLHGLALAQKNEAMRAYYSSCDVVYADGMPVVMIARLLGYDFRRKHRITSLDFIGELLNEASDRGWRVCYLGSRQEVVEDAADVLRSSHPGLKLSVRSGYFDMSEGSAENAEIIAAINSVAPDLLIVGMGMPRQEEWLLRNAESLTATVLFPIGALADYLAGAIPTPPRWAGRWGVEWLFRLFAEPRRLARRYLLEPWALLVPVAREWYAGLGRRRRERRQASQE